MVSLAGAIFLLIILTPKKKESEVCACISFVAINTYVYLHVAVSGQVRALFVYSSSQSN